MTVIQDPSGKRSAMVERLFEDLVGPRQENEKLKSRPSDVYLTGVLWPMRSATPGEEDDRLEVGGSGRNEESSDGPPEEIPAKSVMRPSTAGVSFSVRSAGQHKVNVEVSFARYNKVIDDEGQEFWERTPVDIVVEDISCDGSSLRIDLTEKNKSASGAELHVRAVEGPECRLVTVTLINSNLSTAGRDEAENCTFFQTELKIVAAKGSALVPRPSGRDFQRQSDDDEAVSNALLFRNVEEFAAGHTCSAEWSAPYAGENGSEVAFVRSTWLPSGIVPDVSSAGHAVFEGLASLGSAGPLTADFLAGARIDDLLLGLEAFCAAYGGWISIQASRLNELGDWEQNAAEQNIARCRTVLARMSAACDRLGRDTAKAYAGAHDPIVDKTLWDEVQTRLRENASGSSRRKGHQHPSLLIGKLIDGEGRAMTPSHAQRGRKRYRYYVTRPEEVDGTVAWRVNAHDLERLVCDQLADHIATADILAGQSDRADITAQQLRDIQAHVDALCSRLRTGTIYEKAALLERSIARISVEESKIAIKLDRGGLAAGLTLPAEQLDEALLATTVTAVKVRRGHQLRLIIPGREIPRTSPARPDGKLIALVADAIAARQLIEDHPDDAIAEIARRHGRCRTRLGTLVRLSCLAPDIITSIIEGRQPTSLTARSLATAELPLAWSAQRQVLGCT